MTPTIVVNCTHGREDAERATLSFVVGNVSATADQSTAVLLTCEGVWLGTKGYVDDVAQPGLPPLREVLDSFVAAGGEIWACGACTGPRGITGRRGGAAGRCGAVAPGAVRAAGPGGTRDRTAGPAREGRARHGTRGAARRGTAGRPRPGRPALVRRRHAGTAARAGRRARR